MHHAPGRIHGLRILPKQHRRLHGTDARVRLRERHHFGDRVGMEFCVIVEQEHVLDAFFDRVPDAAVIPFREARIRLIGEKGHARQFVS